LAPFFDFIRECRNFCRILNEAEFFAPIGYQKHLDNISTAYVRILRRGADTPARSMTSAMRNSKPSFTVHGRAGLLSRRYSYAHGAVTAVPDHGDLGLRKLMHGAACSAARRITSHDCRDGIVLVTGGKPRHRRGDRVPSHRASPARRGRRYRARTLRVQGRPCGLSLSMSPARQL